MPELQRHAVGPNCGVKRGGDAEQLEQNAQTHARPALEETSDRNGQKKRHEKDEDRDGRPLRFE